MLQFVQGKHQFCCISHYSFNHKCINGFAVRELNTNAICILCKSNWRFLGADQHGLNILKKPFSSLLYNNEWWMPFFFFSWLLVFYKTGKLLTKLILKFLINALSSTYSGSVPSLAAGLFFGSLAGLGAYQVSQNPNNIWVSLSK